MRPIVICLLLFLSSSTLNAQKLFRFGFVMGTDYSYFNYKDLGFLEIPADGKWGGKIGFNYIFNITDYFAPRLSSAYTYQRLNQTYNDSKNEFSTSFQNHLVGLEVIPVSVKFGGMVKGGISAGMYFQYLVYNDYSVEINGLSLSHEDFDLNKSTNGFIVGLDFYVRNTFLEIRLLKGSKGLIKNEDQEHSTDQIQILINL